MKPTKNNIVIELPRSLVEFLEEEEAKQEILDAYYEQVGPWLESRKKKIIL